MGIGTRHFVKAGPQGTHATAVLIDRLATVVTDSRLGDRVEHAGFDESAGLLMWCGHFQAAFEAFSGGQSLVDVATDLHGEPPGPVSRPEHLASGHEGSVDSAIGHEFG